MTTEQALEKAHGNDTRHIAAELMRAYANGIDAGRITSIASLSKLVRTEADKLDQGK